MEDTHGDGSRTAERRGIKFDRLISILQMLIIEGRCTTDKLANEFKVSKKTITRDMDVLTRCFPIRDEPDPNDTRKVSWIIDGEDIRKSRLSIEEQLALAIAKKANPFGNAFRNIFEQIERKALRAAAPASRILPVDAFVFTAPGDVSADKLQKKLLTLAEASIHGKCVCINYRTLFRDNANERTIEPAYLFCSTDGFWYVTAFCRKANKWRTFALDQILEYEYLDEPAREKLSRDKNREVSAGFGAFHGGEETNVVVHFSPYIRPYIERRKWHASETKNTVIDSQFGEGSLELRLRTTGLEGIKHWLKQWIPDMRVIEPDSLRLELVTELERQLQCLG